MTPLTVVPKRSNALFVSPLQRSDEPTEARVQSAIRDALRRLGASGCAERVAQEFGDHPLDAVSRMAWVLDTLRVDCRPLVIDPMTSGGHATRPRNVPRRPARAA